MRIELKGVRKDFGKTQVLKGIDLDLPSGRRVALIGPNGSGKSTLLRALLGLIACDGTVKLGGRSPFEDRVALARELAYVPQIAPGLSASCDELVRAVTDTRELSLDAIAEVARALELDLAEIARRPFRNLSGGMKQKLLVALAMSAHPALLVLDEPTASLDARARDRFFQLFERLPRAGTVILCSHRLEELRSLADHVVVLSEGKVAWDGPASEFLGRQARSIVEVRVADEADQGWLSGHGFHTGAQGWWIRTVTQAEKLELLPALTAQLGGRLQNVLIRDLENVEVERHG